MTMLLLLLQLALLLLSRRLHLPVALTMRRLTVMITRINNLQCHHLVLLSAALLLLLPTMLLVIMRILRSRLMLLLLMMVMMMINRPLQCHLLVPKSLFLLTRLVVPTTVLP